MPALRSARRAALLLAVLLAACAPAVPGGAPPPAAALPTTVIVVRHAERISDTDRDSPLSAAGEARAAALAEALAGAGVEAIYATEFRRTRDTARPLAERLGVPVRTHPGGDTTGVARQVLAEHRGGTVLLVGHSNTVPALVRVLGGRAPAELTSRDYDDLFIVTVPAAGAARTVHARYGPPSP